MRKLYACMIFIELVSTRSITLETTAQKQDHGEQGLQVGLSTSIHASAVIRMLGKVDSCGFGGGTSQRLVT